MAVEVTLGQNPGDEVSLWRDDQCMTSSDMTFSAASLENLPRDVTQLQTLLLPPNPSPSPSTSFETHQTILMEQSLKVISKLAQILQVAFSAYHRTVQDPRQLRAQVTDVPDGHTGSAPDPGELVEQVGKLIAHLVPAIMGRLADDETVGRVVGAVVEGIIKPCIEAVTTLCVVHRQNTPDLAERMVGYVRTLLDHLSRVTTERRSCAERMEAERSSDVAGYPFADAIALYSTEAICTYVRKLVQNSVGISPRAAGDGNEGGSTDRVVPMLVQLAQGSLRLFPYMDGGAGTEEAQDGVRGDLEGTARRYVKTARVCDGITKLAADLQWQVNATTFAKNDIAPGHQANSDQQRQASDGRVGGENDGVMPLWKCIGMKRETMVALCVLAERFMVWEYCVYLGEGGVL